MDPKMESTPVPEMSVVNPTKPFVNKKFLMHGWTFREIRKLSGYSAREIGRFMASEGMRPTTARGIYLLERRGTVKPKHVQALRRFLGEEVYNHLLEYIVRKERDWHTYDWGADM